MNFLKRAMLAVTRRRSKSFIMFIIFATIANLVIAGFAIQHATDYASTLARQKLGGQLFLRFNNQWAVEQGRSEDGRMGRFQAEPIPEDMIQPLIQHSNIIDFNVTVNTNGLAEGFEPVVTTVEETTDSSGGNIRQALGQMERGGDTGFVIPDVTVVGVATSELLDNFNNGEAMIIEGRHLNTSDAEKKVAIIEKNLAEENDLTVGQFIEIQSVNDEKIVEFKIVGIYETTETSVATGMRMLSMPFMEPFNRIYVDYKSAMALKYPEGTESMLGVDSAVFFIDDPKNIDTVKADAENMSIDWDRYILDANDLAFQQMMGPIENVASFSMMVVYIIAIAGALILTLLLTLSVKERMYETGVLLSMGEGKLKVISQYVAEVLIIAVIAFGVSAFSGNFIAQAVGDTLLEREVRLAQEQGIGAVEGAFSNRGVDQTQGAQFRRLAEQRLQQGGRDNVEAITSFDITITLAEILRMTMVGLFIILVGTILPSLTIMRYNPKTILTKAT